MPVASISCVRCAFVVSRCSSNALRSAFVSFFGFGGSGEAASVSGDDGPPPSMSHRRRAIFEHPINSSRERRPLSIGYLNWDSYWNIRTDGQETQLRPRATATCSHVHPGTWPSSADQSVVFAFIGADELTELDGCAGTPPCGCARLREDSPPIPLEACSIVLCNRIHLRLDEVEHVPELAEGNGADIII